MHKFNVLITRTSDYINKLIEYCEKNELEYKVLI